MASRQTVSHAVCASCGRPGHRRRTSRLCPQNERNRAIAAAAAEGREWIPPPPRDIFCIKDSLENSLKVMQLSIHDRTL